MAGRGQGIGRIDIADKLNYPMSFDLQRFIDAQSGVFESALAELRRGRKVGHWMWFIFPQMRGLGTSLISQRYAIQSRDEATAYLAHPILGQRLIECTESLLSIEGTTAEEIFGYPDVLKLRSSLTLFEQVSDDEGVFSAALEKYYQGQRDPRTLALLEHNQT